MSYGVAGTFDRWDGHKSGWSVHQLASISVPTDDCSAEAFGSFLWELLSGPEPELETIQAAEALWELRVDSRSWRSRDQSLGRGFPLPLLKERIVLTSTKENGPWTSSSPCWCCPSWAPPSNWPLPACSNGGRTALAARYRLADQGELPPT